MPAALPALFWRPLSCAAMSDRSVRRWFTFLLCVALAPIPAAAESAHDADIVVRVYDGTQAERALRIGAIRQASGILAATGLAVAWHDCTGDAVLRHCDHLPGGRTLIVRIAPRFVSSPAVAGSRIETRHDADASGLILGFAVVEPSSGGGVMATVFLDRVHAVARRAGIDAAVLLGRAISHEVGHLLLASNAHADSGLMREVWTDVELALDRRDDWLFTAAEESRLHQSLRQRPAFTARYSSPAPHISIR